METSRALVEHHKDRLIVLKVFAPWCKACKGLEPKFNAMVRDPRYEKLPIVWADLTIQNNKEFVKSIGVLALPTIQFYARGQRMETFACGPSKVPILKRKLVQFINQQVDPKTFRLKDVAEDEGEQEAEDATAADGGAPLLVFPEEPVLVNETTSEAVGTTWAGGTEAAADAAVAAPPAGSTSTAMPLQDIPAPPTTVGGPGRPTIPATASTTTATTPPQRDTVERVVEREKSLLRGIKYLSDLLESEFVSILSRASLLTFESGSIIMKEGNPGRTFYVLLNGEVEICQRTSFEDPLTTPPSYLGTVINRLDTKGEYFGERSLITGEPRAASIRASRRTTCLAIDKDDFPITSVLSGRVSAVDEASKAREISEVNDKYGMSLFDFEQLNENKQYQDSITASQVRGSANQPGAIDGVDNDKEVQEYDQRVIATPSPVIAGASGSGSGVGVEESTMSSSSSPLGVETETIVPLLFRFKLIRSITRCFDYIVENRLRFGDAGTRRRRTMLVNLLSTMQQQEIAEAFRLIDDDGDGQVTLMELRRLMDSVGEERSDQELLDLIEQSHFDSAVDREKVITAEDFTGLMAEAEIYHLFLDTFKSLDPKDSGFVRAKDLDRVLRGVRDLIHDDRHSIIDVEDRDMMVDYEQFARMLLGTALKS
jgi:calmodulin